jgi:serine/threonine protein kinase
MVIISGVLVGILGVSEWVPCMQCVRGVFLTCNHFNFSTMEKFKAAPPLSAMDYSVFFKEYRMNFREARLYWQSGQPGKDQGWILHISVHPHQVKTLLRNIFPVLKASKLSFKIVRSKVVHLDINNGFCGGEKIGKAVTIYVDNEEAGRAMVPKLIDLTDSFEGPFVRTDFQLGKNLYTRYGAFRDNPAFDVYGRKVNLLTDTKGASYPDSYRVPPLMPEGVQNPFKEWMKGTVKMDRPKELGGRFFPWSVLQAHLRGNVYKGIYFNRFFLPAFCVVKEGRAGILPDNVERDVRDRLKWQSRMTKKLGEFVDVPKVLEEFSEGDQHFLAMEYIASRPLGTLAAEVLDLGAWREASLGDRKRLLGLMECLLEIVSLVHKNGFIHRDINGNNFLVTKKDRVYLIDLELVYSVSEGLPDPAFGKGTGGFISPNQEQDGPPVFEDDIYSLGATISHLIGGVHPILLWQGSRASRYRRLKFLIDDQELSETLVAGCDDDVSGRPALADLSGAVQKFSNRQQLPAGARAQGSVLVPTPAELLPVIHSGLNALAGKRMAPDRFWCSCADSVAMTDINSSADTAVFSGLAKGMAGVAYLYARAHSLGIRHRRLQERVDQALAHLRDSITKQGIPPGLFQGSGGIGLAFGTAIDAGLIPASGYYSSALNSARFRSNVLLDVANGVAGQGLALLSTLDLGDTRTVRTSLEEYVRVLVRAQQRDGSWKTQRDANSGSQTCAGFAEGVAGIAWFLLECGRKIRSTEAKEAGVRGMDWLRKKSGRRGGHLVWPGRSNNKEDLISWFSGSAGIALAFLKATEVTGDSAWLKIATEGLLGIPPTLLTNRFSGLCGMAGIGETYLEAFSSTGDPVWMDRAGWIARVLVDLRFEEGDNCWWLVDNTRFPTADLMVGNSGILHFLLRFANPGKLSFPMLPG